MSNDLHASFSHLDEDAFRTYATDLLEAYPGPVERQRLQAYLQQTCALDKRNNDTELAAVHTKRMRRRQHQNILEDLAVTHAHDFGRSASLFTEQSSTDTEILALLTNDNAEVYIRNRNITGTVLASGDNIKFAGLGATGSAVGGDLACTCVVTGRIIVSGSDVTLEGLHFKFASEWTDGANEFPMISFTGGTNQKLTLKNCIFEHTGGISGAFADGRFLSGSGSGGGTQSITGCLIKNFTSWMLFDATTNSGTPTVRLDSFVLDSCKIENCMGSGAVRGMSSNPNGSASFTNNLFAFGAQGQHASFWDCVEANNTLRVICTGNETTGATHGADRGFLQAWARTSVPWSVTYKDNTIANFGAAFRCACNATFYSPNTYHEDEALSATAAETTNVTYGGTYVYPYTDATKTYAPENIATFAAEPAGQFAGLSNFAHA